ncbi:cytochrome b5 [Acaromyces ingoldii]|uniref:Cytochrome b5 n=1 Tax=Acaromyces ingoldii TaxID=215250 RepID=A0A316YZF1_9BASI|nr:cytochrome b5 [Acaromyces ingoldii]PWN94426.1 cytochrome b5 [Acaromyces ingoldii]
MSEKKVTMEQLGEHKSNGDLWLLVDGKVYDVSKFADEHPGGDEVLLSEAGKDATESFEDVGHSDDARALLPGMLVGEIEGGAAVKSPIFMFIPLLLLGAWIAYRAMN